MSSRRARFGSLGQAKEQSPRGHSGVRSTNDVTKLHQNHYIYLNEFYMASIIKISVLDIDEDDISKFRIQLCNNTTETYLDYYQYLDDFKQFAADLISFPKTVKDSVIFEIGLDSEEWAYYGFLKVFCYEPNGRTAIHVKMDNHRKNADLNKAEFYIKTVPSSINKLGQLLYSWNPLLEPEITWIADPLN